MIPADPIEQAAQSGKALEAMLRTEKLLRAEIKRLRGTIDQLIKDRDGERGVYNKAIAKHLAEIKRLEAECHQWKHHAGQRLIALREVEAELRAALARKDGT